jgi:pyrroloquinoline-quinone synthase
VRSGGGVGVASSRMRGPRGYGEAMITPDLTPAFDLSPAFDLALADQRLLDHPYYQSWQEGLLSMGDLAEYAEQYRYFERCLPGVLETVSESLAQGTAKRLVDQNLRDESGVPRPHVDLFEGFAAAVGARRDVAPTPATRALVALYEEAASSGAAAALAVIGTYEIQASEVARTKAASLRAHYAMSGSGTEFWDVHAELETAHSQWTVEALAELGEPDETVLQFARASSDAWWAFLGEREEAR